MRENDRGEFLYWTLTLSLVALAGSLALAKTIKIIMWTYPPVLGLSLTATLIFMLVTFFNFLPANKR